MKEIWKDIKGYEGLYQVSNLGRIKSLRRFTKIYQGRYREEQEKIMSIKINKFGYCNIGLRKNGERKWFLIHRLVAQTFIKKINGKNVINHINENKSDNRVENLEWCDMQYNNTYGSRIEKAIKKTSHKVSQYTLEGEFIKTFDSISSAGRSVNGSAGNIWSALNGVYSQSKGYKWRYGGDANANF